MLERGGLARTFPSRGRAHPAYPAFGSRIAGNRARELLPGPAAAYDFQCSLPQWRTEAILRDHLAGLGLGVEFGTEVTSIEDDPNGVRITLGAGGRTETVTAAYLLGAGGGHSITRHSMHEHLSRRDLLRQIFRRRREGPLGLSAPNTAGSSSGRTGLCCCHRCRISAGSFSSIATMLIRWVSFRQKPSWALCSMPGPVSMWG